MELPRSGTNSEAVELTIAELIKLDALDLADTAHVTLARRLATAVDETPGNASLWTAYAKALDALLAKGAADDGDSAADVLRSLFDAANAQSPDSRA